MSLSDIPTDLVLLTDDQLKELFKLVPTPPGFGKSALVRAKKTILQRVDRKLKRVKMIRTQKPFDELREAIRSNDLDRINQAYKDLHDEMKEGNLKNLPEYKRINSANDPFVKKMKRAMADFYPKVPDNVIYQPFKEKFPDTFAQSFIEQGLDIGTLAGMALGQPISQMVLSAFHTTNESMDDSSEHFPRLRQILNASQENKFPHSYIAFCDPEKEYDHFEDVVHVGTFDEIYNRRRTMEEVNLKSLSAKIPHLVSRSILERDGVTELITRHNKLFPGKAIGDSEYGVELTLDPYMLYFYNLKMSDISRSVEKSSAGTFTCVWSTQNIPGDPKTNKLWILPPPYGRTNEMKLLNEELILRLDKFLVSGYIGIKKLLPVKETIPRAFDDIRESFSSPFTWVITTDSHITRTTAVSSADVANMLQRIGFTNVKRNVSEIRCRFNPINFTRFSVLSNNPDKVAEIKGLIRGVVKDKNKEHGWIVVPKENSEETMEKLADAFSTFEVTKRSKAIFLELKQDSFIGFIRFLVGSTSRYNEYGYFYSAVTQGISSTDLRRRFDIDLFRYYTNDPNEMQRFYGLYISMYTIINEFTNIILTISDSTNVSHILMLFSNLFQTGRLTGVVTSGAIERGMPMLARSSLEKAGDNLSAAARSGLSEMTKESATASLHVGRNIASGTGAVDTNTMHQRINAIRERMQLINADYLKNRGKVPERISSEDLRDMINVNVMSESDYDTDDSSSDSEDDDDDIPESSVPVKRAEIIPIPNELSDAQIEELLRRLLM